MSDSTWYILGAGSIGSLLAHHFTQRDQQQITCHLLLRDQAHLAQYQQAGGIHLQTPNDSTRLSAKPKAYTPDNQSLSISQLIITTKAHQTVTALQPWLPALQQNATIILLQNGMGVIPRIKPYLPHADYVLATTTEGANRMAPFTVHHAGRGTTWFGRPQDAQIDIHSTLHAERTESILKTFERSGFPCRWDQNIEQRLWQKLAINCAINGLTIIHDCKNGELISNPSARPQFDALISELEQLYAACHPTLAPKLRQTIYQVATDTAQNICSTLQDWRNQRPTELPFLNGFLLDYAEKHQIDLPMHRKLMTTLLEK